MTATSRAMDGSCLNHVCPYSHCIHISHGPRRRTEPSIFENFLFNSCLSPPFQFFHRRSLILCLLECLRICRGSSRISRNLSLKSTDERLVMALVVKRLLLSDIRCRRSTYIHARRYLEMVKQPSACKKVPAVTSVPALPVLNIFLQYNHDNLRG